MRTQNGKPSLLHEFKKIEKAIIIIAMTLVDFCISYLFILK